MKTRPQLTILALILVAVAAAAGITASANGSRTSIRKEDAKTAMIERGKHLVGFGGCNDCHTPLKMGPKGPEPDMTRALSGHPEGMVMGPAPKAQGGWMWSGAATNTAFAGPWGVSYAANLTADRLTGTGIWDEQMFIKTIRTGRHWGVGRPILPPMPYQAVQHLSDDDLKAVFAYIHSLKPIKNQVPDAVIVAN
jgi:mono/diheme cytochrome c family protein